ncbi:hypothetical protein AB9K34_02990 [Sedimentitalea sp. XS_ASV28]|uniref:hypothetical protein n=1 Tax=Sedimentitalea sp. XS_ASV28 TaxID=3241296 RepID=UPI003515BD1D
MLDELRKILGERFKRLGVVGPSFLAISAVIGGFIGSAPTEKIPDVVRVFFVSLTWMLFAFGILTIVLRLVSGAFSTRPAKGLIDGMAAGLVAGFVGGMLGYAGATHMHMPGFEPMEYGSLWSRLLPIIVFSVPLGGIVGMALDFAHPSTDFHIKKYIGAILLGLASTAIVLGGFVTFMAPVGQEHGIQFQHLQVIYEVYLLSFTALVFIEKSDETKGRLIVLATLLVCTVFWRLASWFIYVDNPYQPFFPNDVLPAIPFRLYTVTMQDTDGLARFSSENLDDALAATTMMGIPIFWVLVTYFVAWRVVLPTVLSRR